MNQFPRNDRVSVGHPVDVATGAVFTAATDWVLPGNVPFRWRRFYTTASARPSPLGNGWQTIWFMTLTCAGGKDVLVDGEGQPIVFSPHAVDGRRISPKSKMELLERAGQPVVYDWGHFQRYVFEPSGPSGAFRLAGIENLAGDQVLLRYDGTGLFREIEGPGGRRIRVDYNDTEQISQLGLVRADGSLHVFARYEYDRRGCLVGVRDACGHLVRYEYDGAGRLTRETNRIGGSFHFDYDDAGRCVRTWGDGGYLERCLEYDESGRRVSVKDSRGASMVYHLGPQGGIRRIVDSLGGTTQFVVAGAVSQRVDAGGAIWLREIDVFGNVVREVDPTGAETSYEYNDLQQCVARTNPEGNRWEFRYTPEGLPACSVDAAGNAWTFIHNDHGRIVRVVDPLEHATSLAYDPCGNIVARTDPAGGTTRYAYDDLGNLVFLQDRQGNEFRYDYDPCGRLTRIACRSRVRMSYRYDAEGRVVSVTNRAGAETCFEYSPWGHRLRTDLPPVEAEPGNASPASFSYEYDTEGLLVRISAPGGDSRQFAYDASNRLAAVLSADGAMETYTRDAVGNVIEYRRGGLRTLYAYDPANRLLAKNLPDGESSAYSYDIMGRITSAENQWAKVSFAYDAMGNPVEETQNDTVLHRTFDAMGNCLSLSLPEGEYVEYSYDANRRATMVRGPFGQEHSFSYAREMYGPTVHRFPNGLVEHSTFEPYGGTLEQSVTTVGSRGMDTVARRKYFFDGAGRVSREVDWNSGARSFSYDAWGRLVSVDQEAGPSEAYAYDQSDNLIDDSRRGLRRYGPGNRISEDGRFRYGHEDDGLRLVRCDAEGRRTEYRFDTEGRLLSVTGPDGDVSQYRYDPFGRRIAKVSGGETTRFWWDGTFLLQEENGRGADIYLNYPRTFRTIEKISRVHDVRGGETAAYCYHLDLLGTPRELTDGKGRIVWRARYSAYGEATVEAGEPSVNRIRFPGQYYDAESGLHYNIHRYYNPQNGRYICEDPIGLSGGTLNLFSYAADPINRSDPLGLDCGDPDAVHIYHGTLDADALRGTGFTTKDKYGGEGVPPYVCVTTDRRAAEDALSPSTRYDARDAPAPELLTGSIPRAEWDRLHSEGHLSTNDYSGFGHSMRSTETKARTPEGVQALNTAFGLPGGGGGG